MKEDNMKQGWEIKKLGEVCEVLNGYAFDSNLFTDDNTCVPIIRIRDIKRGYTETFYKGEYSQEYIINKGDYLIGMDGEFNIAEWQGKDSLLNQRVCKLSVASPELLERFVLWFMPNALKKIEDETPFVTVKHLSSKKLLNIPIPVPPLPVQEQIVSELDLLSGIIEKKREQLKELDALAQSIFYDMFGDPITNEKGWEVKKLGEVCESELGKTLDSKRNTGELYPYLCTINIQWGYCDLGVIKELRMEREELERYSVKKGDLLICEGGDTGRSAIWNKEESIYYQNSLHRVRFKNGMMLPIFCQYLMWTLKNMGEINKYSKGQTIQHLVKSALLSIKAILPPLPLQHQFASKIEAIERQKELIKQSISETETLFNERMQHYFG